MLSNQLDLAAAKLVRALPSAVAGRSGWVNWPTLAAAWICMVAMAVAAEPTPKFADVAQAVAGHFQAQAGYQPGDLLSQPQVAAALEVAVAAGWNVPDRDKIVSRALADDSFLVRELSTPAGRKFMRKIARQPGAYSRLDRLSTISRGESVVRDLIKQKDGDKMIEYLATTRGGQNLGRMMAGAKRGVDLNKPTGRIYTADDLLAALKKLYNGSKP
jgi:hypothetical protein